MKHPLSMDIALLTSGSRTRSCFKFSLAAQKAEPPQLQLRPQLHFQCSRLGYSSASISVSGGPPPAWGSSISTSFPPNPLGALPGISGNIITSAPSQTQKWASCTRAYRESDATYFGGYGRKYIQNGGIGVVLLSVTSNAKVKLSPFVATLAANPTFVSGLFAWFIAQSIKVVLNFFVEKKWDLKIIFASGGMPSSHSALCTALSTSVALCHGVADSLFPVCLGFSSIVMYDAIGVRRHAGMQAEVSTYSTGLVLLGSDVLVSFCSSLRMSRTM